VELIFDENIGERAKEKEVALGYYDTYIYVCKHPCIRIPKSDTIAVIAGASQESDDVDVDNRQPQ